MAPVGNKVKKFYISNELLIRDSVHRRNQIVHESDLVRRTKAKQLTLREISASQTREWISWTREFVAALDRVIETTIAA